MGGAEATGRSPEQYEKFPRLDDTAILVTFDEQVGFFGKLRGETNTHFNLHFSDKLKNVLGEGIELDFTSAIRGRLDTASGIDDDGVTKAEFEVTITRGMSEFITHLNGVLENPDVQDKKSEAQAYAREWLGNLVRNRLLTPSEREAKRAKQAARAAEDISLEEAAAMLGETETATDEAKREGAKITEPPAERGEEETLEEVAGLMERRIGHRLNKTPGRYWEIDTDNEK